MSKLEIVNLTIRATCILQTQSIREKAQTCGDSGLSNCPLNLSKPG